MTARITETVKDLAKKGVQNPDDQTPDNQQGGDEQTPAVDKAEEKGEDGTP